MLNQGEVRGPALFSIPHSTHSGSPACLLLAVPGLFEVTGVPQRSLERDVVAAGGRRWSPSVCM